jgi:hypothetical protein
MKLTTERRALERELQRAIRAREKAEERRDRKWLAYYAESKKVAEARGLVRAAWNKARGTRVT